MANQVDLTTVDTMASVLSVPANDANLPRLITAASTAIRNYVGYDLHQRAGVVETATGTGTPYLFLKSGQVTSITSISIDGATVPSSEFFLDSPLGRVRRLGCVWPFTGTGTGRVNSTPLQAVDDGSISVTFDAGWVTPGQNALDAAKVVTLPADIEQACVETVTAMYRRKGRDMDVDSMSLGDGSFSYGEKGAIPATARKLLSPYRKITRRLF